MPNCEMICPNRTAASVRSSRPQPVAPRVAFAFSRLAVAVAVFSIASGALGPSCALPLAHRAAAAEFYVDPQNGDPNNDGSKQRPWRSLKDLFDRGLIESRNWESLPYKAGAAQKPKNPGAPIRPGDTIRLNSGDYGELVIDGYYNEKPITIEAAPGAKPRFDRVHLRAASNWVLRGLIVSGERAADGKRLPLVHLESHGWRGPVQEITIEDCTISSADDSSAWSADDWNRRARDGIRADGPQITIRRNRLKNVNFGISAAGPRALVEHNTVENFAGDGLRGLGDYSVFQYNVVKNCYDVNDNHDDGFQSWSVGPGGVGTGEVKGIVLRGNTFINYEDPKQPHRGPLQGIGCFDGMFVDWVIENNVVVVDHYHGITLAGARGCKIVNNTVIDPNDQRPGPSAIRIGPHKNKTPSRECTVRNNLASALDVRGESMTADHNVIVADRAAFFENAAAFDFRLRPGSPAIDAGLSDAAPKDDRAGVKRPQGRAVDLGAYERPAE